MIIQNFKLFKNKLNIYYYIKKYHQYFKLRKKKFKKKYIFNIFSYKFILLNNFQNIFILYYLRKKKKKFKKKKFFKLKKIQIFKKLYFFYKNLYFNSLQNISKIKFIYLKKFLIKKKKYIIKTIKNCNIFFNKKNIIITNSIFIFF
jgi:hypothetical protein